MRCCTCQICCLSAATAKAFTTVFAGFALTFLSSPNIILTHAFVAGLVLVLMRQMPGIVKMPVFLTSFVATVTRLFKMLEKSLVFISFSVASNFSKAPFDMAFELLAFIDFMAFFMGAMFTMEEESKSKIKQSVCPM